MDGRETSVISYVLQMRDKLETFRTLAKDNLQDAQKKQKVWYDTHARERDLKPGQKVLVLLPSGTCKLLAKWQGPYVVTQKLGPVTYENLCPKRKHSKQILHVNLLKEFKERGLEPKDQVVLMVRAVMEEEDELEMEPSAEDPGLNLHLSEQHNNSQRYVSLFHLSSRRDRGIPKWSPII